MLKIKKQLYYSGNIENLHQKLNIFILELDKNKDIAKILNERFNVIWYINEVPNNNSKHIKIAEVYKGKLYISNNTSIEEIMYYLMNISDVIVVGRIFNIKEALNIIDMSLSLGKEIICIKDSSYLANILIKDGANCV